MPIDDAPRVEVHSRAEWRRWLEENHETAEGVWLVTWKKHHPDRYLPWGHIVKEALCFGWVDSRSRRVDDDRTSVYVTRRKAGSPWSALNKGYVEELENHGLMTPAGRALIAAAREDGSWTFLDDVEALVVPDDLGDALGRGGPARDTWEAAPASVRKRALYEIKLARTEKTRRARIDRVVARCSAGERPA
jgi:uncharacterized protein YdeI (YjbR/CyaY-like superfamily)